MLTAEERRFKQHRRRAIMLVVAGVVLLLVVVLVSIRPATNVSPSQRGLDRCSDLVSFCLIRR
jgi:hypothetical protein